jgi:hypothetical protein
VRAQHKADAAHNNSQNIVKFQEPASLTWLCITLTHLYSSLQEVFAGIGWLPASNKLIIYLDKTRPSSICLKIFCHFSKKCAVRSLFWNNQAAKTQRYSKSSLDKKPGPIPFGISPELKQIPI